jgi:hypothetical protein
MEPRNARVLKPNMKNKVLLVALGAFTLTAILSVASNFITPLSLSRSTTGSISTVSSALFAAAAFSKAL